MAAQPPERMVIFKLGANEQGQTEQVIFDKDLLTQKQIRQFRLDIANEVEAYMKDIDKYQDDFQKLAQAFAEDSKKKEKESDKVYEKRVSELTEKFKEEAAKLRGPDDSYWKQELAARLLKVIARMAGQEHKVTPAALDGAPWEPMKRGLAEFLINQECDAGTHFLPPRLSEDA